MFCTSCLNILNFHFNSFELKICSHLNLTVAGSSSGLELLQWLLGLISLTFVYALNMSCVIIYFISGNVHLKKLQISVWGTNVLRVFTFSCFTWLYLSINKYFKHWTSKVKLVILCHGLTIVVLFDSILWNHNTVLSLLVRGHVLSCVLTLQGLRTEAHQACFLSCLQLCFTWFNRDSNFPNWPDTCA